MHVFELRAGTRRAEDRSRKTISERHQTAQGGVERQCTGNS